MSLPKGRTNNPTGRTPGVPNKATKNARLAIAAFVDDNAERLTQWLDRIAEDDPKGAFQCFMDVVEYHIPKLSRTEQRLVDEDGNDRDISITINRNVYNAADRDK